MNKHFQKAIRAMEAARPASGFCPETEDEWLALQKAQVELGYAMFRDSGKSELEARALADVIYGGAAGRLLLQIAFSGEAP
jgi:hypothetical protein